MADEVIDAQPGSSPGAGDAPVQAKAQAATDLTAGSRSGDHAEPTPPATELDEFKATVAKAQGKEPVQAEIKPKAEAAASTEDEPGADGKAEGDEAEVTDLSNQGKDGQEQPDPNAPKPEKLTDRAEWQAAVKIADKLGKAAGVEMRGIMRGMFKREHELTKAVEALAPAKEVVEDILQSVGGSQQGFDNIRLLVKNFDADPDKAVPMLELLLDDARKRSGRVLQAPELLTEAEKLDQQVKDGAMEPEAAAKRKAELLELQKAKTTESRVKQQSERARQTDEQRALAVKQEAAVKEIASAAEAWEKDKLATDPDYPAVKQLHTDRVFALAEREVRRLGRMLTGKEAKLLADEALKQIKAEVAKFKPKPKQREVISGGDGSSGNRRQEPANEFEEFQQRVAEAKARH